MTDNRDILRDWVTEGDVVTANLERRHINKPQGAPTQTVFRRGQRARGRFDQLRRAALARKAAQGDDDADRS